MQMSEFTAKIRCTFEVDVPVWAKDEDAAWDHVSDPAFLETLDLSGMKPVLETLDVYDIVESDDNKDAL